MLGQKKLLQRLVPGLMHAFIFWGFLVLFPTIVMAMIAAVDKRRASCRGSGTRRGSAGSSTSSSCSCSPASSRRSSIRKLVRPARFDGSHLGEADVILLLIAGVVVTLLCWHAAAHAAGLNDPRRRRSPRCLRRRSRATGTRSASSCGRTSRSSSASCATCRTRSTCTSRRRRSTCGWRARARPGRLEPLRFDVPGRAAALRRRDDLRPHEEGGHGRVLVHRVRPLPGRVPRLCDGQDPLAEAPDHGRARPGVRAEHGADRRQRRARGDDLGLRHLRRVRRGVPGVDRAHRPHRRPAPEPRHGRLARSPPRRSRCCATSSGPANPWGKPQTERAAWAEELGVKVLEPGDPRRSTSTGSGARRRSTSARRRARESTAKLLQKAGVDFAILGPRESCTGDPARRMGNEYVFQAHAEQNVATLKEDNVQKIVASCPHCFNTLANEYGDFGGNYEVLHHTELLSQLVEDGRLKPAARRRSRSPTTTPVISPVTTTSRMEPRKLLNVIGQPVEMKRSGKQTFCCGAGGAHMWMEEGATQINVERAREAIGTGAETLAVACPFCTVMLDDGVRETGGGDARGRRLDAARRVARRMIVGLGHVDLVCRDLARSLAFMPPSSGRSGSRRRSSSTASAASRSTTCAFPWPGPARSGCGRRSRRRSSSSTRLGFTISRSRSSLRVTSMSRMRLPSRLERRSCMRRACGRSTTRRTTQRSSTIPTASGSRSRARATRGGRNRVDAGPRRRQNPYGTLVPRCEMADATGTQAIDRAAQLLVRVVESCAAARRSASSRPGPGCRRARPRGSSAALERQGLVQRLGDRAPATPRARPAPLRAPRRLLEARRARRHRASAASPTRRARRSTSPCPARTASSTSRSDDTAHFVGVTELGRAPGAVRARRERQGLPGVRRGAVRAAASADTIRARGYATTASTSSRSALDRDWRRPSIGRDGRCDRRALDLRAHRPSDLRAHRAARAASDRRSARRSLDGSATATTREVPHDPRGDPQGPLRQHARRQCARGEGPDEQGPRGRASSPSRCSTTRSSRPSRRSARASSAATSSSPRC